MSKPSNIKDPVKFFERQGFVISHHSDGMDFHSTLFVPSTRRCWTSYDPNPIDAMEGLLEKICDTLWVECIAVEERYIRDLQK